MNALIDFIKNGFQYFNKNKTAKKMEIYSNEIINYCMQHMKKSCETYNLNKLQHLLDIYKVLLHHHVNDVNLQIQLIKCLVQVGFQFLRICF